MKACVVLSHDRISLKYAYSESRDHKPWIVLIMPFGLSLDLARPFFDFFKSHYNVITWESRSILDPLDRAVKEDEFSANNHVKDLLIVLQERQVTRAILVGYCSGAGIALIAINRAPQLFTNLILVHGEYTLLDEPACTTQFALDIDSLLSMAAASEDRAVLVFNKVKNERFTDRPDIPEGIDLPFSQLNYFRRHAANYIAYKSVDYKKLAAAVDHKVLLLTGKRDLQANIDSTRKIKELIRNSEIYVDPKADHYGLVRPQSRTLIAIWNYLCEQTKYTR